MTVQQVADRLGVTVQYVRQLAAKGRLKGEKIGNQWLFSPEDVDAFEKKRRPVGRPKIKKSK